MSIEQSAYDIRHYEESFKKNEIERETGKSMDELLKISNNIISYLKSRGGEELLRPDFNEREILHMRDVQKLFTINKYIKYLGIFVYLILLIYLHRKKDFKSIGQAFFIGPFLNYLIFIILTGLASLDFNKYFTYFHKIFFFNDLWLMDPNTDLMIQMLPEDFFIVMSKNIMLSFSIYMVILQIMGYLYIKKGKENLGKTKRKGKKSIKKK